MRLLVILLTILLFLNLLGFVLTNLETRVDVTVWKTQHHNVPLFAVVILAVLAGIVYAGVIAVAEGANLRLANHRLQREIQKLETELNYLRTQPVTSPRSEPDAIQDLSWKGGSRTADADDQARTPPASAPVYEAEGAYDDDRGDDTYSGGRAV
jgi:uncharacterized integral membrane protein